MTCPGDRFTARPLQDGNPNSRSKSPRSRPLGGTSRWDGYLLRAAQEFVPLAGESSHFLVHAQSDGAADAFQNSARNAGSGSRGQSEALVRLPVRGLARWPRGGGGRVGMSRGRAVMLSIDVPIACCDWRDRFHTATMRARRAQSTNWLRCRSARRSDRQPCRR